MSLEYEMEMAATRTYDEVLATMAKFGQTLAPDWGWYSAALLKWGNPYQAGREPRIFP